MQRAKKWDFEAPRCATWQEKMGHLNYESCIITQMERVTMMGIRSRPKATARPGNYTPKINDTFILPIVSPGQEYEDRSEMTKSYFSLVHFSLTIT